jgi:hypothetical protein
MLSISFSEVHAESLDETFEVTALILKKQIK